MDARDIFIKRTGSKGSVITQHRVWDAEKFVHAQQKQAATESDKNPNDAYSVSVSNEAEYKQQAN